MPISLSKFIRAPADVVYSFFEDPANTLAVNDHAVRFEVVEVLPDGRRTFDVTMRAGPKEWMQTIEQVVREPNTRLVTRGGSWTTDRGVWLLTVTTDRRFSPEGEGTRVDVSFEARLDHPLRRPVQAISNWLRKGATRSEFERQLDLIAERIERGSASDSDLTLRHGV